MCGINGIILLDEESKSSERESSLSQIESMNEAIRYRGPDSGGLYESHDRSVFFGHRRLSIIDTSSLGSQPMTSMDGNYVIIFNGEIYNFIELRLKLEKKKVFCRSMSDTEVLLESIACFGLESALNDIIGMYAFAVYDKTLNVVHLARDRAGEKPLYYGVINKKFVFSSELKCLEIPFNGLLTVSRKSAGLFLSYGYFPGEYTIFNEVKKLNPGTFLTVNLNNGEVVAKFFNKRSLLETEIPRVSHLETVDKFDELLRKVISDQMIADVSLGSFLSGGVDSSLVTSIMCSLSSRQIETFTIGFNDKQYDESSKANEIAKHLGANANIVEITEQDLLEVVDTVILQLDEPFANASAIPSFILSKFASKKVSVCLSGDGGDELFIGYNRYSKANKLLKFSRSQPNYMKKTMGAAVSLLQVLPVDSFLNVVSGVTSKRFGVNYESKIKKLKLVNRISSGESLYKDLVSYSDQDVMFAGYENDRKLFNGDDFDFESNFIEAASSWDIQYYLPGDCLYKTDRTAMANSLEVRVPLLDSRITSFANSLSIEQKLHNKTDKAILKDTLSRYVPSRLFNRPKMGFTVPLGKWITGPLSSDIKRYLSFDNITAVGILDHKVVSYMLSKAQNGSRVYDNAIWACYVFQKWMLSRGYTDA